MDTEYEIKILEIEQAELTEALLKLGFEKQASQYFKRYVYDVGAEGSWARLRTDGNKTTLTYKSFEKDAIDGTKELEVEVSDFVKTNELMIHLGYTPSTYQENRRITFTQGETEITIDSWPHIPTYAEIEAKDKVTVEKWLEALKLGDKKTTSEPTSQVYKIYGLDINSYSRLEF